MHARVLSISTPNTPEFSVTRLLTLCSLLLFLSTSHSGAYLRELCANSNWTRQKNLKIKKHSRSTFVCVKVKTHDGQKTCLL